ncbi:MAG: DegV family protein [Clostridia bacterium]|nr:DegV family protein [Clostridia bacterium]
MRIITDSAADFTNEELKTFDVECVRTQVMIGNKSYTPGIDLTESAFWNGLLSGEDVKTSQPSPDAFLKIFENIKEKGEEAVYISISSALSGTLQSARIAASMLSYDKLHIVDSLNGAAGQKLLVMHACRLRDEGKALAGEIVSKLNEVKKRIRLFASLDTLDNLARSGRISKTVASIGTLAKIKPLLTVSEDGRIVMTGKALGRHRAIESLAKRIAAIKIDREHPVIPLYSYDDTNCRALVEKLKTLGVQTDEALKSAIGTAIAPHIGPGAYGAAFVTAE